MQAWTTIRIALWGNSVTTGKLRSHTRIDLSGDIPTAQAIERAKQIVAERHDYFNNKQYLLNCIDTGNFCVERTA
jgi:hypothetical protein